MLNKILNTFRKIAKEVNSTDGGKKITEINKILKEANISSSFIPGIGLLINKQEKPTKVIISHFDLIKKFQKGFKNKEIAKIEKGCLIGALDNTITNAILIEVILELKRTKSLNETEFLLSDAEEINSAGVRKYLKDNKKRLKDSFFINLDVTNEGFNKSHISIEYDECNFKCLKEIQKDKDSKFFFTAYRVDDDTSEIINQGFHGLSFCLPTEDIIHSYKNKCRLDSLEPFLIGLITLIKNKSKSFIGAKKDIKDYMFNKALKVKSKRQIEKKRGFTNYYVDDLSQGLVNVTEVYNRSKEKAPEEMSNKKLFGTDELEIEKDLVKPVRFIAQSLYEKSEFYKRLNAEERNYFLFTLAETLEMGEISADFIGYTFGIKAGTEFIKILKSKNIINKKGIYNLKKIKGIS